MWCTTAITVILCVLFDYIVPFSILGFSAFARNKNGEKLSIVKISVVFSIMIAIRFVCHYITGVAIWGQWAPDGMGKFLYSFLYNIEYMLPELIITVVIGVFLMSSSEIEKLLTKEK